MFSSARHEFAAARILYRQFLFRIVELESLSSKADVTKLLGQFASVLLMVSVIQMFGGFSFMDLKMTSAARQGAGWGMEHLLLSLTFLVVGCFTILSWDALLPDQRDVFVLGPLPVKPLTLWFAKLAASSSAIGASVLVLNCASGLIWPAALASPGFLSVVRSYGAYWLTVLFAAVFLFSAILAFQSAAALLLSRSSFLRLSSIFQMLWFGGGLASFFFDASALTPQGLAMQSNVAHVAWFPPNCFTAMFFQMQGDLSPALAVFAFHGWILLAASAAGVTVYSVTLYPRLLSRIAATPEIVPSRLHLPRLPSFGDSIHVAVRQFIGRSFLRGRQQRLIAAFYFGIGAAILSAVLETVATDPAQPPSTISLKFLVSTIVAMTVTVVGVRAGFALPVSLRAHWVFQLHQIRKSAVYLQATRDSLLLFTVLPVCIVSAIFGFIFEPAAASLKHVALLGLYGTLLTGVCLYGNLKLPYTCSYLPDSARFPFFFWGSIVLFIPLTDAWAQIEQRLLNSAPSYLSALAIGTVCACLLEWRNRSLQTNVDIRFDDIPEDILVGLDLGSPGTTPIVFQYGIDSSK